MTDLYQTKAIHLSLTGKASQQEDLDRAARSITQMVESAQRALDIKPSVPLIRPTIDKQEARRSVDNRPTGQGVHARVVRESLYMLSLRVETALQAAVHEEAWAPHLAEARQAAPAFDWRVAENKFSAYGSIEGVSGKLRLALYPAQWAISSGDHWTCDVFHADLDDPWSFSADGVMGVLKETAQVLRVATETVGLLDSLLPEPVAGLGVGPWNLESRACQ